MVLELELELVLLDVLLLAALLEVTELFSQISSKEAGFAGILVPPLGLPDTG